MQTLYALFQNADMTEGRGPMLLDSLWTSEEEILKVINPVDIKIGWYSIKPCNLVLSAEDYKNSKQEEMKKAALAKLTPAERRLLGL